MKRLLLLVLAVLVVVAGPLFLYTVDETEQVVVTMFGRAVGDPITSAGLHLRLPPPFNEITRFPRNLLEWDGAPGQVPTRDKTFIFVDVFGRWRIADALRYFETINNERSAQGKLDDIIDAAVRNVVTSNILIESVRNSNRALDFDEEIIEMVEAAGDSIALGRGAMAAEILEQARSKLAEFGIELVDVRFKRIMYVDEVLANVYDRMIAERKQIAEKYRSEGRGESSSIAGRKERELKGIYSEAYRDAQVVKGEADATAAAIYAGAYNRDPEFYSFVRTLELYRTSLDSSAAAILSTDAEFLRYLRDYAAPRR